MFSILSKLPDLGEMEVHTGLLLDSGNGLQSPVVLTVESRLLYFKQRKDPDPQDPTLEPPRQDVICRCERYMWNIL